MYEYKAVITNIVDGDTYDMDIDLGFHIHIHERVRVLDLDTPEKFGEEKMLGRACADYAKYAFLNKKVIIRSKQELLPETDSFGRWLVEVIFSDGKSAADIFTSLGANKKADNYSAENVKNLYKIIQ